jgi:hypothetical protein
MNIKDILDKLVPLIYQKVIAEQRLEFDYKIRQTHQPTHGG